MARLRQHVTRLSEEVHGPVVRVEAHVNTEEPILRNRRRPVDGIDKGKSKKQKVCQELAIVKHNLSKQRKKVVVVSEKKKQSLKVSKNKEVVGESDEESDEEFDGKLKFLCVPQKIVALVDVLSAKQKRDVVEIGFGGILKMTLSKPLPHDLSRYLIDNLDANSYIQYLEHQQRYQLRANDVYDIFELPFGGTAVKDVKQHGGKMKGGEADADSELRDRWRNDFPTLTARRDIKLKHIFERIKSQPMQEGSINFKRLFVIYVFGYLLDPTATAIVDLKLLNAVEDVEDIPKQNWCDYVLKRMGKTVVRLKKSVNYKKQHGVVGGCLLVLLISYMHRCALFGVREPSILPLIQHWDSQKLKNRVDSEKPSGFGKLMLDEITYPVTKDEVEVAQTKPRLYQTVPRAAPSTHGFDERPFIRYNIPEGVMTDAEILESIDDDAKRLWALLKRDVEVVTHAHMSRFKEFQEEAEQVELSINQENVEAEPSPTQKWFEDSKVHEIIDKLTSNFAFNAKIKLMPVPSYDLGFGDPSRTQMYEDDVPADFCTSAGASVKAAEKTAPGEKSTEVEESLPIVQPVVEPVHLGEDNADETSVRAENVQMPDVPFRGEIIEKHENVETDEQNSAKQYIDDGCLCSLDCGEPSIDVTFASEFMKKYKLTMMPMEKLRKEVADYCFFQESEPHPSRDLAEAIVIFGETQIVSRDDMKSLLSNEFIYTNIIDCWSLLMNQVEIAHRGPNVKIYCFGTNLSGTWRTLSIGYSDEIAKGTWDAIREAVKRRYAPTEAKRENMRNALLYDIEIVNSPVIKLNEASMIMVPLHLCDHYTLYVINIEKKKIQYLDNLSHDGLRVKRFYKSLIREMSIVLEMFKHKNSKDILEYEHEYVQLPWNGDNQGSDCGVFVMKHMELFDGVTVNCNDLKQAHKRYRVRAEICASLVLSNINQVRPDILVKVNNFIDNKPLLIKEEVEAHKQKKKEADVQKKKEAVEKRKKTIEEKKKKSKDTKKVYEAECGNDDPLSTLKTIRPKASRKK